MNKDPLDQAVAPLETLLGECASRNIEVVPISALRKLLGALVTYRDEVTNNLQSTVALRADIMHQLVARGILQRSIELVDEGFEGVASFSPSETDSSVFIEDLN